MQSKAYNAVFCTLCDRLSGSSAKCKLNLTHFPFGSQKAKFSGAKIAKGACTTYTKISAKFLHLCQQTKPWHFTFSLLCRALPHSTPAAFSKRQDIARFCCLRRRQPAGHIKACKNPKTQTFCIPLRRFFRKCIRGKKRCLTLQKSPVSHTVIWDIQKSRQKSSLRRAERNQGSTAPHPPENNEKVAQSFKKRLDKVFFP